MQNRFKTADADYSAERALSGGGLIMDYLFTDNIKCSIVQRVLD